MNILDYIYPPRCPVCGGISDTGICAPCREKLFYIRDDYCLKCGQPLEDEREEYCADCAKRPHSFDAGRAVFSYQGDLRRSLYRLKYGGMKEYGRVFGAEMAISLGGWIGQRDISRIVPIPLHPVRLLERGYNQAAIPAAELGKRLDIPVDEGLLRRVKPTAPQKMLTGSQRRDNLADAFELKGRIRAGESILLVDDIYTTGSTVDAAAACLKQGGKCLVYVVVVAIGG